MNDYAGHTHAELQAMADQGMTRNQIADHVGVNHSTMRSTLLRMGISPERRPLTIREKVDDMEPLEAVNFLLWIVENTFEAIFSPENFHPVDEICKLAPQERNVMILLYNNMGKTVFRERLVSLLNTRGKEFKCDKYLDVLICICRRKIKGSGFRIDTDWGEGYRMERVE